jgi:hypothetical protein
VTGKIKYEFTAETWQHNGTAGWHFVALPKDIAKEIRQLLKNDEEGWGRLKAMAKTGNSEWKTAIWFDTKRDTYLLPLKAEIRKKEHINSGERLSVSIWL